MKDVEEKEAEEGGEKETEEECGGGRREMEKGEENEAIL